MNIYKKYNKLIRDNIYKDLDNINLSVLNKDEYKEELYKKIRKKI